ncbi:hypothetical protein OZL92_18190 [Bacillus sonorensis]|uniref:Membrane protein YnfC n=2 Tax=Bacillus sonorensis TaxID=119858 RepID=M5PEK2_9BACI|nr:MULTISPECIES: hypothetical protein [Bacillus]TWK84283.1 hypothetical protein CHCC20335_4351 [Bacillus paralicheniformis]ASB89093.1 uncharacterized protein S101395_02586 [Bacillus sonorensis]EME75680.1 membrane protein YnfC [Bacillus sonorensis L12]MBG9915055.1 membrane protein [Bacillus sonorensis]MCF7618438.1 hypothetical protein [Bacillus sonorensis]
MKKSLFLQMSMFFLVIASLHSFSMPHVPMSHHAQKAAVSGDELHELTAGKHGEEKAKSLWDSHGLRDEFILLLILAAASARVYILNRLKEHLKAFMLAVFYHSSYVDKAHV